MNMRKPLTALAAMVFAGSIGGVAIAQDALGHNHDISQTEVANFDRFLDTHPADARRLAADPSLINRPDFIEDHPGLHEFLENHPAARAQWRSHPYRFIRRENRFDRNH